VVCVTTGLLQKLDRDELQGVIAHEMSHIRNYDVRFMTTVVLIAGLIPLLADFFIQAQWWTGGSRGRDNDRGSDNAGGIFQIVGIVLAIVAPMFAMLLQLAVSRQREYLADASAAELTRYPEGLARALAKISSDPAPLVEANRATAAMYIVNPREIRPMQMRLRPGLPSQAPDGGSTDIFSTHPGTEDRIRRLMGMMGSSVSEAPPLDA
jgi:heat shock protein HtpX